MKRTGWILGLVMVMAIAMAHAQDGASASRDDFGSLCGLKDISQRSALRLARSSAGKWSFSEKEKNSGSAMAARVWHEGNWFVDLHDAPGSASAIHNSQFCFDSEGRVTHMIDRYMELAQCRCLRFTSLSFAPDGTIKQREQTFVDILSNQPMAKVPEAAKSMPAAFNYRRLNELPFYSLLKK